VAQSSKGHERFFSPLKAWGIFLEDSTPR